MKSGRKAGIGLLVTVLVLVGLVVLADRGAAWAAEDRIAGQVALKADQQNIAMQGEPEVTVEGFPFLTQVLAGEYEAVTIRMEQVTIDGVQLESIDVRATTVRADLGDLMNGSGEVRAERVAGEATVSFAAVRELIGYEGATVTGQDGKLLIRVPLEIAGGAVSTTVVALADVSVSDGAVKIDVDKVNAEDENLPPGADAALDRVAGSLSRTVPLPKLPYGMTVGEAKVTDAGVAATASARDVPLG